MAEPIRIRKLDHVVLRVRDSATMIAFYCDVLGCVLEKHSTAVAGLIHLRAGESLIDLMPAGDDISETSAVATNMDHLCIQVEPYTEEGIRAHLNAHDVDVSDFGPRFGADGDGFSIYIRDPEGNEVELKAPPDY